MKKIAIALLLALLIAVPCQAEGKYNKVIFKNVFLLAVQRHVLVNRMTEQVKYILLDNGKLVLLKGPAKLQFQAMYDFQRK